MSLEDDEFIVDDEPLQKLPQMKDLSQYAENTNSNTMNSHVDTYTKINNTNTTHKDLNISIDNQENEFDFL